MSCGVVFHNKKRDISLVVHGDDFTFCGVLEDLEWIKGLLESWFEIWRTTCLPKLIDHEAS